MPSTASQIGPYQPTSLPEFRVADSGVADTHEAVPSANTHRVYGVQRPLFESWCNGVGPTSFPPVSHVPLATGLTSTSPCPGSYPIFVLPF